MIDPHKEIDRERLFRAMESSHRKLEPFRKLLLELVVDYAGSAYGDPAATARPEILVNLLNQAVDAYTMALVANRPRIMVSTPNEDRQRFAKQFELAMNHLIEEMKLELTLRQAVLDAFFCVGVVKLQLADSPRVKREENIAMDPGVPFVSNVSLANWVFDIAAPDWHKVRYCAESYRVAFDDLTDDVYDPKVVKQLSPSSKDVFGGERLEMITRGQDTDDDEVEPMIDLMDVWLPREKMIYTFAMDSKDRFVGKLPPLTEMEWDGSEFGPYKILAFNDVPQNIMPTSPASHLAGLARAANTILRKQRRRSRSQKNVHTYTPAGADDAKRIQSASDDEWIKVADASEIGKVEVGGVDATSQAFFTNLVELFDRMGGNLSSILGLGAQAETLGQEQLIYGSASKKIAQMQYRVVDFTEDIIRDLGHMLWTDAAKTIPGKIEIEGAPGFAVDATWTPDLREGDFYDYGLNIDVYSMPYQSPMQRFNLLNSLIAQVYIPLAEPMAQQGGGINFQKLREIHASLINEPRLNEIIEFTGAPPQRPEGNMPQSTSREYVRKSVPGGSTPQGQSSSQQQAWLSHSQGGQQQAPLPVGSQ